MSKYRVIILCVSLVVLLCGCSNSVTIAQSEANFAIYEQSLSQIVEEKNLSLIKVESENPYSSTSTYWDYDIFIDYNQSIHIQLYNSYGSTERFSIIYYMHNSLQVFDVDMVVALINAVSGEKVTKEYIEWFLLTPEEEFKNYGRDKHEDDVIFKFKPLNFWEDWTISYRLKDDDSQELVFYGLTDSNR